LCKDSPEVLLNFAAVNAELLYLVLPITNRHNGDAIIRRHLNVAKGEDGHIERKSGLRHQSDSASRFSCSVHSCQY
jgi:hypothetical protein